MWCSIYNKSKCIKFIIYYNNVNLNLIYYNHKLGSICGIIIWLNKNYISIHVLKININIYIYYINVYVVLLV